MAKKKTQTLEEAVVPEHEQPYAVPGNWVWTRLDSVNTYESNSVDPSKYTEQVFELYSVPIFETNYPELLTGSEIGSTKQGVEKNDVLLCKINPRINRVWRVHQHTANPLIASSEWIIIRSKTIESKYLQYCLTSHYFRELLLSNVSGVGGSLMRAQPKYVKGYAIPLPPLAEQQRIVARIESLFEKLDQARELVQQALESFETRKAAILHKAFTGELTEKWREENGVGLDSWDETSLGKCGTLERGRSKHRPRNAPELFGGPYPFIQTGDVANAEVYVTQHKQTLSEVGLAQSRLFPKGTLCITIAANIGEVAILSYDSCFPDSVVGFTPDDYIDSKYIYYIMSVLQKKLESEAPATAQKNINLKVLNDVTFRCPSFPEQQEIVHILDDLLAKEQKAKEQLEHVLDQIDLMKKSILARAFHGELGTNDPNEESAVGLLKEILT